jgi:hypothetical protein
MRQGPPKEPEMADGRPEAGVSVRARRTNRPLYMLNLTCHFPRPRVAGPISLELRPQAKEGAGAIRPG